MTQPYDDRTEGPADQPPSLDGTGGFGDTRVDAAVARLGELGDQPVAEHVHVFDDIHARLRDALEEAAVDPAPDQHG
jgi:hypothetical protein